MTLSRNQKKGIQLLHSVIGLIGDLGELATAIERWIWYGHELDETNLKEELGDLQWYVAEACDALKLDLEKDVHEPNIRKLRKRFPDKFDSKQAREENRDREEEREALNTAPPSQDNWPEIEPGAGEQPERNPYLENELKRVEGVEPIPLRALCRGCKQPLSDEVVKALKENRAGNFKCPNCQDNVGMESIEYA